MASLALGTLTKFFSGTILQHSRSSCPCCPWCCLLCRCPYDTTTKTTGATSLDECLVPPGYFVKLNDTDPNTGVLEKCPKNVSGTGYYRAGWVSFSQAKGTDGTEACTPCGSAILSAYRDEDEIGDGAVVMAKDPEPGRVPASSASCCEFNCCLLT
jgi:hypothetical protein